MQATLDTLSDYRRILDRLINHDPAMFALSKDARVVDLGCGFGGMLDLMRQRGYTRLVGVEPDEECRRGAGARGFEIAAGTLSDSGLPGRSCADAVIVNQVFHHIDDLDDAALREISRYSCRRRISLASWSH